MCCKLWQHECAWPQRDLFQWQARIANVNKDTLTIKYNIVNGKNDYGAMSKIIKPCGRTAYSGRTNYKIIGRYNCDYTIYIVGEHTKYVYHDDIISRVEIYNNSGYLYTMCEFEICKIEYLEYYVKEHDNYRYKLYSIIRRLIKYLTRAEVARLAIASGKYTYNLIIGYANERHYYWSLGGSKI
jgi:hypothetical protein